MKFGKRQDDLEEEEDDFESLFEQETVYRNSRMLSHLTMKASVHVPFNPRNPRSKKSHYSNMNQGTSSGLGAPAIASHNS